MKHSPGVFAEWALMVLISAFLFVGFFRLNDLLFAAFEHAQGINWIFLPSGFRVLLVLVLGWPGALGILGGTVWLDQERLLEPSGWLTVLLAGLASGFGPWLIKRWMVAKGWLDTHLRAISAQRLLNFVLLYAVFNSVSHQIIRWGLLHIDSKPWLDVWPMFIGDALGALTVLYTMKYLLGWLGQRSQLRS